MINATFILKNLKLQQDVYAEHNSLSRPFMEKGLSSFLYFNPHLPAGTDPGPDMN